MRVRTWSACVALAWGILLIVTAAGPVGSLRLAQATTRIASSTGNTGSKTTTQVTLTSSVTTTPARASGIPVGPPAVRPDAAEVSTAIARPTAQRGAGTRADIGSRGAARAYIVQPGDTLSGIAAALGTPGGWPALYAANRELIGPDPGLIRPGTALTLPGQAAPARYTVAVGDTLSGIASALGTPGGWPALYAANRRLIGSDPNAIRAGTVLAVPHPASPTPPGSHSAPVRTPTRTPASAQPSPSEGASTPARGPVSTPPSTAARSHSRSAQELPLGGLPRWLEIVLAAAGLLIATAFLTEPILAVARRRRAGRPSAADPHIVLADYERLVVTHSRQDGTVYVLRPPGADPRAILLAARLVLAQDRYDELAGHLGVPAHWSRE